MTGLAQLWPQLRQASHVSLTEYLKRRLSLRKKGLSSSLSDCQWSWAALRAAYIYEQASAIIWFLPNSKNFHINANNISHQQLRSKISQPYGIEMFVFKKKMKFQQPFWLPPIMRRPKSCLLIWATEWSTVFFKFLPNGKNFHKILTILTILVRYQMSGR